VRADRGGAAGGVVRAVGGRDAGGRVGRRDAPYARGNESEAPDACTVFVGNLPYEVTWQDLKDHMAQAGEVAHADVKSGPDGRSKGVGIVRYHSADDAATAIESLSETNLGGRNILVRAQPLAWHLTTACGAYPFSHCAARRPDAPCRCPFYAGAR
jgi:hypothetical protein